jgi:hypothetical protein
VTIYLCPKRNQWSHQDCDCPGEKDDEQHSAVEVSEAAVAKLVNLIGTIHDQITDGDDPSEMIADVYLEITGNLI